MYFQDFTLKNHVHLSNASCDLLEKVVYQPIICPFANWTIHTNLENSFKNEGKTLV